MPEKPPPTKDTKIPVSYEMDGSMQITGILGWSTLHHMWGFDEISIKFDHGIDGNYLAATMMAAGDLMKLSFANLIATIPEPIDL
jgi:hypothetical protein